MATKTYFLAPNFNFPPDSFISLGHIITNPADPGTSLNPDSPLSSDPSFFAQRVVTHVEYDSERLIERCFHAKLGVWARFVGQFGLGDVSVRTENAKAEIYKFRELETKFFQPTDDFLDKIVLLPQVLRTLTESKYRKPVYMITGVKIARGAMVRREVAGAWRSSAKAGIDGEPTGLPIDMTVGGEALKTTKEKESFSNSSDFVFAFRLRQIFYKKGRERRIRNRDYTDGALFATGSEENNAGEAKVSVLGLANSDVTPNDIESTDGILEQLPALDDDDEEECQCVLIKDM